VEFLVNRRSGVSIRDQLRYQFELKILTGELSPGQRLPSVRALARRLEVHVNTVAGAYKDLEATSHVEVRRGAGLFVRPHPSLAAPGDNLDDIVRTALQQAFRAGHAIAEIRSVFERWLDGAPVAGVVVVDPAREMAEVLAEEIRQAAQVPVTGCAMVDVERRPCRLSGTLTFALPYHIEPLVALLAAAAVEPLQLSMPKGIAQELEKLPEESSVLVVSHAPTLLPFADVHLKTLVGGTLRVTTRPVTASREWRQLLPVADLVLVDVLSAGPVRLERRQRVSEFRLLAPETIERVKRLLAARDPASPRGPDEPSSVSLSSD